MSGSRPRQRVLIAGSSRGIGLEYARQYLSRGAEVFALARNPDETPELQALVRAHPRSMRVGRIDVADDDLVRAAHRAVRSEWDRVDVLINNAGIYGRAESTLETLDFGEFERVIAVNTLGPLRVAREFLDLLRRGRQPRLVNMTSLMGSIADNGSGSSWAYRVSKTALNMATRNLGHELAPLGIIAVALHPGWVQTDMGGPRAPLSVHDSVASLVATIDRLTVEQTGGFFDRDGNRLPW